jgi:hypothetical protein
MTLARSFDSQEALRVGGTSEIPLDSRDAT